MLYESDANCNKYNYICISKENLIFELNGTKNFQNLKVAKGNTIINTEPQPGDAGSAPHQAHLIRVGAGRLHRAVSFHH